MTGRRTYQEASARGSAPPSPRRWLQFRLRTLLIAAVAICMALGGWHLSVRPYVWAGPAVVGKPFVVRGRFVDFFGAERATYVVLVSEPLPDGRHLFHQMRTGRAERHVLAAYNVELELLPIEKTGKFLIEIQGVTRPVPGSTKYQSVRGTMVVKAE